MMPPPAALTMKPEDVREWWARIEQARKRRKTESDKWKVLLKAYLPPAAPSVDDVNSNIHFRNVESKKASLFFQTPELQIIPLPPLENVPDPQTGQPIDAMAVCAAKRELLNKLLGRDYANVMRTIDPSLSDVLATSGIGATKICYQCDLQPTPLDVPGPDQPHVGSVLGLASSPTTVQEMRPVPVYEQWRWDHFTSGALLQPQDCVSTNFDKDADWLAMEFVRPLQSGIREFKLPPDTKPNASKNDLTITADDPQGTGVTDLLKGVEVWLRASAFDPSVAHSQRIRQLVLIEGLDTPAVYRESPYQDMGPDGRLTADSMIGYPIHPLTIRDLADSGWVPSDAAFTDPLVQQENTWASQDLQRRDANIPRFLHAESITEALEKLRQAASGQGAGIPDELLRQGIETLIVPLPHLEQSPSDVEGRASLRRAIDETLGVGSNQGGSLTDKVHSATEVATAQSNVSVRLQKERNRVLEWYVTGVRKFDALVMRYVDLRNLPPIIGQANATLVLAWKAVDGRNAYDVRPDSQLSIDAAEDRKSFLDYQNFNAKNPYIDQMELSRIGAMKHGYDASKLVKMPQPPPDPKPEPPKISMALKAADIAIPEIRALLIHLGVPIDPMPSPEAIAAHLADQKPANPQHGGAADKVDVLSKHHGELTGGMPGAVPEGAPQAQTPGMVQ